MLHLLAVVKQGVGVEAVYSLARSLLGGGNKAVGADYLQLLGIPEYQMEVVVIVFVQIAPQAAAFTHGAKGDLPQATQLASSEAAPRRLRS